MKRLIALLVLLGMFSEMSAFAEPICNDCQYYPDGQCVDCYWEDSCCNQTEPCAYACGTRCGLTICSVAAAIAAVVGVAAIILATGESSNVHLHNL